MDQLKLLNFHKMIANFATNLVGAFIPLIIYQATNSLMLSIAYLVSFESLRIIFCFALKKLYGKYPQLMLLLRIIPIALYNIFIFVLDVNLVIGVIGVCVFIALDSSINGLPKEIIFNYASLTQQTEKSSIGVTRLFEQAGVIVALVIGGYLLDFNKTLVLILSLIIYSLSVIPLVSFYVKSRKQKTFNKDATSNAINTLRNKDSEHQIIYKKIRFKLLLTYGIVYFSFAFTDLLQSTYSLYIFIGQGEFATAGILNAVFHTFYALGFYVAGIVNNKKDITKLVAFICVLIGVLIVALPFININTHFIFICLIYGTIGFTYPFISLFVLERMLIKSRIMGISNRALFTREIGCLSAYVIGYACGFFGLIGIFAAILISMVSAGFIIPNGEEKTRQHLVDFLQNNETMQK